MADLLELSPGVPSVELGTWRSVPGGVEISCPDCGKVAELDHDVDEFGVVTPSVVCPVENCSFHRWVRLGQWKGGVD